MLSEKLYKLRKKQGLSQEQLAEKLEVSRQTISKWETGQALPEGDKLLTISRYFGVSLDYLMEEDETPQSPDAAEAPETAKSDEKAKVAPSPAAPDETDRILRRLALIACIGGAVGLIVWGILSVFAPDLSDTMKTSSAIHLDGNGIFLLLCIAAIVIGTVLLLQNTKKK